MGTPLMMAAANPEDDLEFELALASSSHAPEERFEVHFRGGAVIRCASEETMRAAVQAHQQRAEKYGITDPVTLAQRIVRPPA